MNNDNGLDLHSLNQMLAEQEEEEINKLAAIQGQIIALVGFLRRVNVMNKDEFERWEEESNHLASSLPELARAKRTANSIATTSEERQEAHAACAEHAIGLATILQNDPQDIERLKQQLDAWNRNE